MGDICWIATYARVSTDEQRDRQSIVNQGDAFERHLASRPEARVFKAYADDGVSGSIPLEKRPEGSQLLADAAEGLFSEIWVVRGDRLGRDEIDLFTVRGRLDLLGIRLVGIDESLDDRLSFGIKVVVAADERRRIRDRSVAGLNRAARDGRYCGGIVPYGYAVEGDRYQSRLVPSDRVAWGSLTEADVVRRMYERLALADWSCRKVADELNALGIPTVYARDGRGIRGKRTQEKWRPGRIRNMVVNPVYRGEYLYGRRSRDPNREVISATVQPLVSEQTWYAAQETLRRNRRIPKHTRRSHLLTSLIKCGCCGLNYTGSVGRGKPWYRCNGRLTARGPLEGRCPGRSVDGFALEGAVWADVERFLRNPGDLLDELAEEDSDPDEAVLAKLERSAAEEALIELQRRHDRAISLCVRNLIDEPDLRKQLDEIRGEHAILEALIDELSPPPTTPVSIPEEMRKRLLERLDATLTDEERREIARLLVEQITVHTETGADGKKTARVSVEYRMPETVVVKTHTEADSWLRPVEALPWQAPANTPMLSAPSPSAPPEAPKESPKNRLTPSSVAATPTRPATTRPPDHSVASSGADL